MRRWEAIRQARVVAEFQPTPASVRAEAEAAAAAAVRDNVQLGWTREQLLDKQTKLREHASEKKKNKNKEPHETGEKSRQHIWSKEVTVILIHSTLALMIHCGYGITRALDEVSAMGRSRAKLHQIVSEWLKQGTIGWKSPQPTGAAAAKYKRDGWKVEWTEEHGARLNDFMDRENECSRVATLTTMRAYLMEHFQLTVSRKQLRKQLRVWKVRYGKGIEVAVVNKVKHEIMVAKYILYYARARQLQQQQTHKIVYTDESYCYNNHAEQYGYFSRNSSRHITRSKRAGRHVIFHAITEDGLLYNELSADDGDLTKRTKNAEYIYHVDTNKKGKKNTAPKFVESESGVDTCQDKAGAKEAYHGYINENMWLQWYQQRLVPAFKATFPDKKMILCMDNAGYHLPSPPGKIKVGDMHKHEIIAAIAKSPFKTNATTVVAMKKEFAAFLKLNKEQTPCLTRDLLQKAGWQLLLTPPYEPEPQPIERIWGMVKGQVSRDYYLGRTVKATLNHLHDAFYTHQYGKGAKREGYGITAAHCQGSIRRSDKWLNDWITQHPHLIKGNLDDIAFISTLRPLRRPDNSIAPAMGDWQPEEKDGEVEEAEEDEEEELLDETEQRWAYEGTGSEQQQAAVESVLTLGSSARTPFWYRIQRHGVGYELAHDDDIKRMDEQRLAASGMKPPALAAHSDAVTESAIAAGKQQAEEMPSDLVEATAARQLFTVSTAPAQADAALAESADRMRTDSDRRRSVRSARKTRHAVSSVR